MRKVLRPVFLSLCALAFPALGEEPLSVLTKPGKEASVDRLVAIRQVAGMHDPLVARALAAAYARLEADPGFSEAEKVAILQALASYRDPFAGPCACRALADPSRSVRRAALQSLREVRCAQAVPCLIELMSSAGADQTHLDDDRALAQRASDLLEILANCSQHFEVLSTPVERRIAVTRWRQWWEAHRDLPRSAWQQEGFQGEKISVSVCRDPMKAEDASALLEALSDARSPWIRENAQELLSGIPPPPAGAKLDQPACAALAKGLDHADEAVRRRAAEVLYRVLSRGGHAGLPAPAQDLASRLKAWWGAHASP